MISLAVVTASAGELRCLQASQWLTVTIVQFGFEADAIAPQLDLIIDTHDADNAAML